MKPKNIFQSGFTLIEVLISISIMVVLMSVVIVNFSGLGTARNLKIAKDNFASNLRRMQSQSLASKDLNNRPSVSYGILVSSAGATSYQLAGYDNSYNAPRTVLETVTLPPRTYIKDITVQRTGGSSTSVTAWECLFTNPYGRVAQTFTGSGFSGVGELNDWTQITIANQDTGDQVTLTVNGITGGVSE